jgi:hypothetical protein
MCIRLIIGMEERQQYLLYHDVGWREMGFGVESVMKRGMKMRLWCTIGIREGGE